MISLNQKPDGYDRDKGILCDRMPDVCPFCHRGIDPRRLAVSLIGSPEERNRAHGTLEIVAKCPREDCQHAFIGRYQMDDNTGYFYLAATLPANPPPVTLSETIETLSPVFAEVYAQSIRSESLGLTQLTGIGFRKALEFLIKDFCVNRHPDDRAAIERSFLGKCIADYVHDPNIKKCAERAAWLGNDETHYVRKWRDKDISDLKLLIRLTMNWVESVLLTEQYEREMPRSNGA